MRDIHSHILPGVDDGSRNLNESLEMLDAAKRSGVCSIVCTPHVRDPWFDYDAMWDAFELLVKYAGGFPLQMGWEVNYRKFQELGYGWIDYLTFDGTNEFLLELPFHCDRFEADQILRTIADVQAMGRRVIIAHPERCSLIQDDIEFAVSLRRAGCRLQASADYIEGGRIAGSGRAARALIKRGLYSCVASDAHRPFHYGLLARIKDSEMCHG